MYWMPMTLWSVFDPEVVLPRVRAVAGVVLGRVGRPAAQSNQ